MRYLYLDESGDLGHDMTKAGTSRYFVITILEVSTGIANKAIEKAVTRTLKTKFHRKRHQRRGYPTELKSSHTVDAIKQYFYRQIANVPFNIYTTILDKSRYTKEFESSKSRLYNFITHLVVKEMPFENATTRVVFTLDRSKSKREIREFDAYLLNQLESRILPQVPLVVNHDYSHENKLLQAVDMFAGGIFQKYESGETRWYEMFQERIVYEQVYPPLK